MGYEETTDFINPQHYRQHPAGIECIDVIEHADSPNLANVIKYAWRVLWGNKGQDKTDLEKIVWYAQRELNKRYPETEIHDGKITADKLTLISEPYTEHRSEERMEQDNKYPTPKLNWLKTVRDNWAGVEEMMTPPTKKAYTAHFLVDREGGLSELLDPEPFEKFIHESRKNDLGAGGYVPAPLLGHPRNCP